MPGGGPDEEEVEVVITVDDEHLESLPAVVDQIKAAGVEVTDVQGMLGTVTGHASTSALRALDAVEGVHVERSRTYQLPPPDSPLQGGSAEEEP